MENLELKEERHEKRRYFIVTLLIIGLLSSCFTPVASFAIGPDSVAWNDISVLSADFFEVVYFVGLVTNIRRVSHDDDAFSIFVG